MESAVVIRDRVRELRRVPASSLRPAERNWRIHTDVQRRILSDLLGELGFADALIARETPEGLVLVDGHLRRDLIGNAEVPVLVLDVTEEEADKLLATLDPLAAMAQTDTDAFRQLVEGMETDSESTRALLEEIASGGSVADISGGAFEPEIKEDEAPIDRAEELREKWGTERGQVWEIPGKGGVHRVMCGDAYEGGVLNGDRPALLLADPPYGIGIVSHALGTVGGAKPFGSRGTVDGPARTHMVKPNVYSVIEGDDRPFDPTPFLSVAERTVLWGGNYYADKLPSRAGWLVWDKREEEMVRNTFAECEMAWTSEDRPARVFRHLWMGLMKGSERGERRVHPTQKPVALMAWVMEQFAGAGQLVYDPFFGSGTTIVACEQTGRVGAGMEISPVYTAVALERLVNLGLEPKLAEG